MLDLARAGAEEGLWLRADRQTSGRGRHGRDWASPDGNFYGSTLVRLRPYDPLAATLALVAAIVVEEVVSLYLTSAESMGPAAGTQMLNARSRAGTSLQWPNDLLVDGEKVAGILLERSDDAVVVGIGVNLAHHPTLDRAVTSLAAHATIVAPETFAETLADSFARWLARWRSEGLAPIRKRWLERAHPLGTALTVRQPHGDRLEGLFDGLDADGALILRLASGERRVIHAGDVFLI